MLLNLRRLCTATLVLAIVACSTPVGTPTANAGPDLSGIAVGTAVQLDGSKSISPQGRPLIYEWSFAGLPSGSHATFNDPRSVTPSFTADVPGTFTVQLIVSNSYLASRPVTMHVVVTQCGANAPTTGVLAASPAAPGVGTSVTLSAPQADDLDNDVACGLAQREAYAWRIASQPPASIAKLNNPTALAPTFTADVAGDYGISLVITDSTGLASTPGTITVTVTACGSNVPVITSIAASIEQPGLGQQDQLTPVVTDADNAAAPGCNLGRTFTYAWSVVSLPTGSSATLNSSSAMNPSFTPDVAGAYTFQLIVTDSAGHASAPQTVLVTATDCGGHAPTATISYLPAAPSIGSSIQLVASVSDLDNALPGCDLAQTFTYAWSLRALPASSIAALNNTTSENPTFTADVAGTYVAELIVTDSSGLKSGPIDVSPPIVVRNCGTATPIISEIDGPSGTPNPGDTVSFTALFSDADNAPSPGCAMGQTFSYAWSVSQRPSGSNAFVLDPGASAASGAQFVADKPGSYQIQLVVTDSTGRASLPRYKTVTVSSCGLSAPMMLTTSEKPGSAAVGSSPNPGQTVALSATWSDADNVGACSPGTLQSSHVTWTLVLRPPNSNAVLANPVTASTTNGTAPATNFVPDVPGAYQFSAIATDSTGLSSAPAFVSFTATNCGANAPTLSVAQAVYSNATPFIALTGLTATAADADIGGSCGAAQTVSCLWSLAEHPAASSALIPDATRCDQSPVVGGAAYAGFAPDVPGLYRLNVIAIDSTGMSSAPATVNVQVNSTCSEVGPIVGAPSAYQNAPNNTLTSTNIGQTVTFKAGSITTNNCNPALNGTTNTYRWSIVSEPNGSQATLSNPSASTPSITFDKPGSYQLGLVVTNALGYASDPVFITITVAMCGGVPLNWGVNPVTASISDPDLGSTVTAYAGSQVTLLSHFSDPNGDAARCGTNVTLTPNVYQWQLVSSPAGSHAQFSSPTAASPIFVPDLPGSYQVSLVVTDALGNSTPTTTFSLSVSSCGGNAPTVSLLGPPLSGNPAKPSHASPIAISTSIPAPLLAVVSDADNTSCPARFAVSNFTYAWSISQRPVGGSATLGVSTSNADTFIATAPSQGASADYEVSVVATAVPSGVASAPGKMRINATTCTTSMSTPGVVISAANPDDGANPFYKGELVALSAAIDDSANAALCAGAVLTPDTYSWTLLSVPQGSRAILSSPSAASPSFVPDAFGTYQIGLVVTDALGSTSALATQTVTTNACGNQAPQPLISSQLLADNNGALDIDSNAPLSLSAQAGDPDDSCNNGTLRNKSFTYAWSIISIPSGGTATLSSNSGAAVSFSAAYTGSATSGGTFTVALTVTDDTGLSGTTTQDILVAPDLIVENSIPCIVYAALGGTGDGMTWAKAMGNLQSAIDLAGNTAATRADGVCSVFVEQGHWTFPGGTPSNTFHLRAGVTVAGGFVGSEASLAQRALDSTTGLPTAVTTLDGLGVSSHVVTGASNAILDGFVVTGGAATSSIGGGLIATGARNLIVRRCLFQHNTAQNGGAIGVDSGDLVISASVFNSNSATQDGGAIHATGQSQLSIASSDFRSNKSIGGVGGAIFSADTLALVLMNSAFETNSALAEGGAVWHIGVGTVNVTSSQFVGNNQSRFNADTINAYLGGALYLRGAEQRDVNAGLAAAAGHITNATLANLTFTGNSSQREGGAMYFKDIDTLSIDSLTASNNVATNLGTADNGEGGLGGAIAAYQIGAFTLTNSALQSNSSNQAGGLYLNGLTSLTSTNTTFTANQALLGSGGAIFVIGDQSSSALSLAHLAFTGNTATAAGGAIAEVQLASVGMDTMDFESNSGGGGGAVYSSYIGALNISSVQFVGNAAQFGAGALFTKDYNSLTLSKAIFTNNTISSDSAGSGALLNCVVLSSGTTERAESPICPSAYSGQFGLGTGSAGSPGNTTVTDLTITGSNGAAMANQDLSQFSLTGCTISDNLGGTLFGGLFNDGVAQSTITSCDFERNQSGSMPSSLYLRNGAKVSLSGITIGNQVLRHGQLNGGSAFGIDDITQVSLDTFSVSGNVGGAMEIGGAFFIRGAAKLGITNSSFTSNRGFVGGAGYIGASVTGGVATATTMLLQNDTFADNVGNYAAGGALAVRDSAALTIDSSTFSRNGDSGNAVLHGGAIHIQDIGNLIVSNSSFQANHASGYSGGAIMATAVGNATVTNTNFIGNQIGGSSGGRGGGLFLEASGDVEISTTTFNGNMAGAIGGGLSVSGATRLAITDSAFSANGTNGVGVLWGSGGGAFAQSIGTLDILRTSFLNNHVAVGFNGGGIAIDGAATLDVRDSLFAGNAILSSGQGGAQFDYRRGGAILFKPIANDANGSAIIDGCTFTQNISNYETVGMLEEFGPTPGLQLQIVNSILWNNISPHGALATTGSWGGWSVMPLALSVTFSDSQDGPIAQNSVVALAPSFEPNSNSDPYAAYRLAVGSPLRGIGSHAAASATDLLGATRANPPALGALELH